MLQAVLVVLLAVLLAAFTYLRLEHRGPRLWLPLAFRAVAWAGLGLLLLNLSCPVRAAPLRPLVLLDASLSLTAPGGRWREARDSARRWGEVRSFGDDRPGADSMPDRGRSLLGPALLAAAASDRPLLVVTDGEIEDAPDLSPELLARTGIRLFPRSARPDLAIVGVTGPSRVTAGDTIMLEVEVQGFGTPLPDSALLEVRSGSERVASRRLRLGDADGRRIRVAVPSAEVGAGDHLLAVTLAGAQDAEPRTDTRLHLVAVAPTPGVVLLAAPGDWDSRFLYRTLREVAQLPVRGYVRLDPQRWRSMTDLRVTPAERVRQAARQADLLILMGETARLAEGSTARGIWSWPGGSTGGQIAGDWYLRASETSPVAGAFLGQPVDSFPPAIQLTPVPTNASDWVGLTAQLGRRGAARTVVFGRQEGRVRRVIVAVDGLWRWAFRGGSSEQSYRAWAAATASWLLGGADTVRGAAHPVRAVVANGRPVVFEWAGSGPPAPLGLVWIGSRGQQSDTLHFDGTGRATVWLSPGEHRYRVSGGGAGTVGVEEYSDELLPRPVALAAREARSAPPTGRSAARDWLWLFALCLLALSAEWLARRRLGLR
jgi:hypothetical protein